MENYVPRLYISLLSDSFIPVKIKFYSLKFVLNTVQSTLDLRNPIFPFLNRELFDLRKILKTGNPKKKCLMYLGEFAS